MTVHMTVTLSEEQKADLDQMARQGAMPPERMLDRLVALALEEQLALAAEVAEARADYTAGLFVEHDAVVAESEARYQPQGGKAPE